MEEALGKIFGNWSIIVCLWVRTMWSMFMKAFLGSISFRCSKDYMRAGFYHLRQKNISIVMVGGIVGHYTLFKYPKKVFWRR